MQKNPKFVHSRNFSARKHRLADIFAVAIVPSKYIGKHWKLIWFWTFTLTCFLLQFYRQISFQTLDDVFGSYCRNQNTFESTRQRFNDRRLVSKKGETVARRSLALHCYTTISRSETKQVSFNLAEKIGRGKNNRFFAL